MKFLLDLARRGVPLLTSFAAASGVVATKTTVRAYQQHVERKRAQLELQRREREALQELYRDDHGLPPGMSVNPKGNQMRHSPK